MKVSPRESVVQMSQENGAKNGRGIQRATSLATRGAVISFHDIHYTVQVSNPNSKCGTIPKEIIKGVSGLFKPGMNAILGPTGGGKSSLLDILAGRKDPKGLTGEVLVDGFKQPKNFKCMTGYVVQDDVVMGTLTVRENFMFSANLRLPTDKYKRKHKEELVEETIEELGLHNCADSKVGTEFIRGVSGGERKRTNIGMELIISPSVLFLDEPTTGLDASTANAVMSLLNELSSKGRTIIFSIHQPRYSIFKQFHRLMLLAGGRTAYHGPANEALQYFESIGYQCEQHNNPPDFFLDVINGDSTAVKHLIQELALAKKVEDGTTPPPDYEDRDVEAGVVVVADPSSSSPADQSEDRAIAMQICDKYTASQWYTGLQAELEPIWTEYKNRKPDERKRLQGGYATSFFTQLYYLSKRAILNIFRNPQTSIMQIFVMVFFAVVVGLIYLQLDLQYPSGIQNRVGAFFFIIMNQVFGNLSAVELFIKERKIFIHENSSGFYRVSSYFFAKVFCDLLPMRLIPLTFFVVITYFMIGLQMDAGKFFIFYLDLFLTTMAASGLGFLISASVGVFAIANLLIAMCYVLMMVFGGLLVNLATMAAWISWLQYLSIIRYSLNTLCINELFDQSYYVIVPDNGTRIDYPDAGNTYLNQQGIAYGTDWDLWQNMMALGLIAIGLMFFAYVQLRRIRKVT